MYTTLGIVFLVVGLGLIGLLLYMVFARKGIIQKKSLIYTVPVFFLVYFMYLTGVIHSGEKITFYLLFSLINKTLGIFGMNLDYSLLRSVAEAYPIFNAAVFVACVLSLITVVFGVLVIFWKRISNAFRKTKIFAQNGDVLIGYSKDSIEYLDHNENTVLWAENIDEKLYVELIKKGYTVCRAPLTAERVLKALRSGEHHMIAFRDSGHSYSELIAFFEKLKSQKSCRLYLHMEASVDEMSIVQEKYVSEVSSDANSFISSFCRYELMARRFVAEHPISKYIPRDFFNPNLTLKPDKEINVVFLGFGKVNYELFKLMATQFQFAKEGRDGLCVSPVHYYVFESNRERLNNDCFIKIQDDFDEIFAESDLPPAEKICEISKTALIDANSAESKKLLKSLVTKDSYTYFIVSLSEDFKNATFAHRLKESIGAAGKYKIFVREKKNDNRLLNKGEDSIVYFGEDVEMYAHESIVNDDLRVLSQNVNDLYNDISKDAFEKYREWQKLPAIEQYSNINAALSIYFKLNLLGFDLKKYAAEGCDRKAFEAHYPDAFMGDNGSEYSYFFGSSTANVLAFIEHSRWNAQYILSGYKPLPFADFEWQERKYETETGEKSSYTLAHKDTSTRRHACLTSYLGLDRLIEHK